MSTYLKHMASYKQSQLKNKSFAEIQKLFDKAMTRVNMFIDMDTELVKESSKKAKAEVAQESSSKRAGEELEQEGDLKTMFEHHVEDLIWRNLHGKKVLLWRLYDSCGIHFVRFEDMHVYMLVEKRYPLTPAIITDMLNKKLQPDYWNEMCLYKLSKIYSIGINNAPSPSNSQTTPETQSPVIPNDVEEDNHDLDVAHMNNDPFFGILIPENVSKASSSSNVIPTIVHTAAPNSKYVTKWTKDHPLDNIISELERPVSTRL
ncbi:hypothetical protein Tco_1477617 [Tanacetum coccineum]